MCIKNTYLNGIVEAGFTLFNLEHIEKITEMLQMISPPDSITPLKVHLASVTILIILQHFLT